jgi:SAM-dependent methyltransferase
MDELLDANRANWDERTALHLEAYPVQAFRAGQTTLHQIELLEVGDVTDRALLHLQCHFGLDTLSWARRGARVTGIDFAGTAISAARALAREVGVDARFIESDVYGLSDVLQERFDIVFASHGVLVWIPDVRRWAEVAASFVRPGGFLYLVDGHPIGHILSEAGITIRPGASYFDTAPRRFEGHGSYVGEPRHFDNPVSYEWQHTLGEIVSAIIDAGLVLEFLHEWPMSGYQAVEGMRLGEDGYWHLEGDPRPFLFSLKAHRPKGEAGTP